MVQAWFFCGVLVRADMKALMLQGRVEVRTGGSLGLACVVMVG